MADDNSINAIKGANNVTPASNTQNSSSSSSLTGQQELGQQEFLTLLVNQLQNQDPLDPMNSEEFAVQLAQFSQLETLNRIDQKLGDSFSSSNSIGSMASYLGNEVVMGDAFMNVEGGNGSNLLLDVPEGTQSIRVDLVDQDGTIVGQHSIDDIDAGRQVVNLKDLPVQDGKYDVRVVSVDAEGRFVDLDAKVTATVEGFVLEPEPRLIVDGEEVALEQIVEVYKGA